MDPHCQSRSEQLRNLGPIALMRVREEAPERIAVMLWGLWTMHPHDLASARADQTLTIEGVWELARQPGLIPSPESHFRNHCIAWSIWP